MTWRYRTKIHPACDVFPMMSDEEIEKLGDDIIQNNCLVNEITFDTEGRLIDGRNRREAADRVDYQIKGWERKTYLGDPVPFIVSQNLRRRHLSKQQQAELIVAVIKAAEKPRQVGEVLKGGRGKISETKARAVAVAKEHGIGSRTVERAIAKGEGREPKKISLGSRVETVGVKPRAQPVAIPSEVKLLPISSGPSSPVSIETARAQYLALCDLPHVDLDAEQEIIIGGLREIAGRRMMDGYPDLPPGLDRRKS